MANLNALFHVGQKVNYYNNGFDATNRHIPCVVKNIIDDHHMIITDTQTNTDLWCEVGFNLDRVFPVYN